ncbi:MAG: PilZ domain-containing protein [Planctomycetes bacterium]|nr:PilZ domain-containing protein [Planctomycetota bacterium]
MTWDGVERRRHKRYGVKDSSVRYRKAGLLSVFANYSDRLLLLNFSEGGLHFITKEELAVGRRLHLLVEFPNISTRLKMAGRVVWVRKSDEHDAFRAGIQLTSMGERTKKILRHVQDNTLLDNVKISTGMYLKEIKRL